MDPFLKSDKYIILKDNFSEEETLSEEEICLFFIAFSKFSLNAFFIKEISRKRDKI